MIGGNLFKGKGCDPFGEKVLKEHPVAELVKSRIWIFIGNHYYLFNTGELIDDFGN